MLCLLMQGRHLTKENVQLAANAAALIIEEVGQQQADWDKVRHDVANAARVKGMCCERDTNGDGNCDRHPRQPHTPRPDPVSEG